jgi:hypothetical protein
MINAANSDKIADYDVDEKIIDDDEVVQESICDRCKAELCRSAQKSCYWLLVKTPTVLCHFITMNKKNHWLPFCIQRQQ